MISGFSATLPRHGRLDAVSASPSQSRAQATPAVPIAALVDRILTLRQVTRVDQAMLMNTLLAKDTLEEEERILVDRVFSALRAGHLQVVD